MILQLKNEIYQRCNHPPNSALLANKYSFVSLKLINETSPPPLGGVVHYFGLLKRGLNTLAIDFFGVFVILSTQVLA